MNHSTEVSNPEASTKLIIVMGVAGSGKSTVAKNLADHYQYCYLDADDFHTEENRKRMAEGLPLTDEMRVPWVNSLKTYLQQADKENKHCVLAFSGLRRIHRNTLRSAGLKTMFIFLNGQKDTIQQRVNLRKNHFMSPGLVNSQFNALEDPSKEKDVHTMDVSVSLAQVIENVIRKVDSIFFD